MRYCTSLRQPRRLAWGLVALLVACTGLVAWWTSRTPQAPASITPLTLLVSGDTRGWIVPCGCTANQSGGMPRRGSHVRWLRERGEVLVVDVGGAVGGTSAYQRTKFEAILKGELAMGLAAHNIGESEAALGADYLRRVAAELDVPFVSANVRDPAGQPLATPVRIYKRAGRSIAVTGVLSSRFRQSGLKIDEPRQAVLNVLKNLTEHHDSVVILAYAPEDEIRDLAIHLPEADAVIGGPTGQSIPPARVGPTLTASATNKGKFLIELQAEAKPGEFWSGKVVEMSPDLPDDSAQVEIVQRQLAALAERDFSAAETGFGPSLPATVPADYALAGNESCRKCHSLDCTTWDKSHHAHAWKTLSDRGYQVDSYCQQCHTNGFGLPGGFVSARRSPTLRGVGCESCHGPSLAHTRNPKVPTTVRGQDQCLRCHDPENSPKFVYAAYWQQIRHGKR
jgi:hypothetical protein